jgi:hypothetical protein
VALSTVDVAGARGNLAQDDGKGFDQVRAEADAEWNVLLSRITIDALRRTQHIFYSALYRVLTHPCDIADADSRVRGPTDQFGCIPFDRIKGESVSLTLEVGIGDDAVSRAAAAAHQDAMAKRFVARAADGSCRGRVALRDASDAMTARRPAAQHRMPGRRGAGGVVRVLRRRRRAAVRRSQTGADRSDQGPAAQAATDGHRRR